ncbi:GTP-binding protein SAR1A [Vitis vinifera]|uniref:GTP-binding protein SAR1A n=1 Tax=Vitis vinifera TaxID=29760 RepID=A0A438E1D3_VITVI|nr:GTP-binding protein SAR1A [Vitis vinifera]
MPLTLPCGGDGRKVDAVVYLVDAYDKERFAESKKELDALLSDEALANVHSLCWETRLTYHMLHLRMNYAITLV